MKGTCIHVAPRVPRRYVIEREKKGAANQERTGRRKKYKSSENSVNVNDVAKVLQHFMQNCS